MKVVCIETHAYHQQLIKDMRQIIIKQNVEDKKAK